MILVTGATGLVGMPLVKSLSAAGHSVRALTRRPTSALATTLPGVEVVVGDPSRPTTIAAAMCGVTSLFVHPRAVGSGAPALLELAAQQGVTNVAVLAAINVDDDLSMQPSRLNGDRNKEVEDAVTASSLPWVSVRPGAFAASTSGMFAAQARHGDVIRWPFARFADAPIHEDDIAAVLTAALLRDSLAGQKISITGPRAVTHEQMVATIGEVIGRPLRYQEMTPTEAVDQMVAKGLPPAFAEAMMARYARELERPVSITDAVATVLGRPARTYADWVRDHAAEFRRPPRAPAHTETP